jgi:hypothetical protein
MCTHGVQAITSTKATDFSKQQTNDRVKVTVAGIPEYPADTQFKSFWVLWNRFEQFDPCHGLGHDMLARDVDAYIS